MIRRMKSNLLSRIIWSCPHQFTWPRRDDSGGYYQLCVNCGSKYCYDWKSMRRTARMDDDVPTETRRSHRPQKIAWKVRERRLRHVVPVLFRVRGSEEWMEGTSENLSRSGLLFRADAELAVGAALEMKLEMPEELTGEWVPEVLSRGVVARSTKAAAKSKEHDSFLIACAIEDYDFAKKPPERAAIQESLR
jgi:hypothetical protein